MSTLTYPTELTELPAFFKSFDDAELSSAIADLDLERDDAVTRSGDVASEHNELALGNPNPGQRRRMEDLKRASVKIEGELQVINQRLRTAKIEQMRRNTTGMTRISGVGQFDHDFQHKRNLDPYGRLSAGEVADRHQALTALERSLASDTRKEVLTELIETHDPAQGEIARWIIGGTSPDYERAFVKVMADPLRGHLLWSDSEREAFAEVKMHTVRDGEMVRAMSTVDGSGGYMQMPVALDPAVSERISNDGATNPLGRILARQVTISGTDTWRPPTTAGVVAAFAAEGAEVADGSPTIDNTDIKAHRYHAAVVASFEVESDVATMAAEVSNLFRDAVDVLEADKLMTGLGTASNEPVGWLTHFTTYTTGQVDTTTAGQFGAVDLFLIDQALPPRFRNGRTSWMTNRAMQNTIRKFAVDSSPQSGRFWVDAKGDVPGTLLGQAMYEASEGFATTVTTTDDVVITLADFQKAYAVVRRTPSYVTPWFHLGSTNAMPTGQIGWYLFGRTGGGPVVKNAGRLLVAK